jgi:hypothetical protein
MSYDSRKPVPLETAFPPSLGFSTIDHQRTYAIPKIFKPAIRQISTVFIPTGAIHLKSEPRIMPTR